MRRLLVVALGACVLSSQLARAQAPALQPPPSPPTTAPAEGVIEKSVVRVFTTALYPDVYRPWSRQAPSESTGSGVVIEGNRILTNAHVVAYASQVQVQANEAADRIPATVEAVAPDMDLAVLRLDDASFFETHRPLARVRTLPRVQDAVVAYGYPTGGNSLSVTKGIVSRIEFANYNTGGVTFTGLSVSGLRIQIDAAINPGNSGGPAVVGDKMIGLAFGSLQGATNIGYIIPDEEIDLFLRDVADGSYDGKPGLLEELQTLENEALRAFLKLPKAAEGMVVGAPFSADPAYPLKKWDLITRIGELPVDSQGRISLDANLRVRFQYMVQRLAKGGKVPLTVVRAGRELKIEAPVSARLTSPVPDLRGSYPSYFVYGPLVFSPATAEFIGGFMRSGASNPVGMMSLLAGPLIKRFLDRPAFPGEALVVVSSPFFPHRLAKGYDNPIGRVVKSVNGVGIRNLDHLVEVLRDCSAEFVTIDFASASDEVLVFPHKAMLAATDEILSANGVRSQGSADMLRTWTAKAASTATGR